MSERGNENLIGWTYLRKSRPEAKNPDLLAEHRSILARLAEADQTPMPPEHIIEEIGTADNLADRPRFRNLLSDLHGRPGRMALYCMDIDRLTKGPLPDRATVYSALVGAEIRIRTPDRWYDLARPDDLFLFELKAMLGHHENNIHHKRVRAKWDEMTRKGLVITGVAPFGYRWDKNIRNFVPEPEELPIVAALFQDALTMSTYRLSKKYGMRASSILRMLTNPVYTGYPARHCYRKRYQGPKQSAATCYLPREEWTWPEQQGTYPAAVSRELFERVQTALRGRHRAGEKTGTTEGWCRDVLEFEGATGSLALGSHGRKHSRYLAYVVRGDKRLYVDRLIVHEAAEEAVRRVLRAPALAAAALSAREALAAAEEPPLTANLAQTITDEISELRRQLDELLIREMKTSSPEEMASIARVRTIYRERVDILSRQLNRLTLAPADSPVLSRLLVDQPRLIEEADREWRTLEENDKRLLTRAFLRRIVVRITPRPHPQPFDREVVLIEYQPWLKAVEKSLADC